MLQNGKRLTLNETKYGKSLITNDQRKAIREPNIAFSFEHFRQIDNFGIGNCSQLWHIGLLERLAVLSKMTPKQVLEENAGSDSLRCHKIDWSAKGVVAKRTDFDWLPPVILDNEDEFPLMQFSISTGTGRFVGFFDNNSATFNVIVLDPNHNIQPSRKHGHQIIATAIGVSQYDDLLGKLNKIQTISTKCTMQPCVLNTHIDHIENTHNIVYVGLDNDFYAAYVDLLQEHSLTQIIETGIMELMP